MKLTPEQKAYFEYGKAWGELKRLREEIIYNLGYYRGLKKHEAILVFRKNFCLRDILIEDAWKKRAACRAWVHPMQRRCHNCKYDNVLYKMCTLCCNEGWPVYWEPRKEES